MGDGGAGSRRRPMSLRRWLAARTLRGRLIFSLVALLALACAAVGLATYLVLHHTLIVQLDDQLAASQGGYVQCIEAQQPDSAPPGLADPNDGGVQQNCNALPGEVTGTFGARLKDGVVTNQGLVKEKCHLSPADKATLVWLPDNGFFTRDLRSIGGDYRLQAVQGQDGDVIITGLPLSDIETTLQKVELAELTAFGAALLLAGFAGTGFVRLSLRPLRRVAATATRVTQLPLASGDVTLAERVPDANPRTEVGQVGAAFNRMLEHVEAALARRAASEARLRRFAADASHELRTPLAAIRGYAELARRHPGPVPAEIEHALSRVESESVRMSLLVDELLLLARLDAGRPLAREPVDLTRLALDATSDAQVAASGHRWLLELPDEPIMVLGDEHRLHQVLANLMSNAAKHTPPGTTVTVALASVPAQAAPGGAGRRGAGPGGAGPRGAGPGGAGPRGAGTVQLSVADDGPGIPPDLQSTLFERFVRADSSRSRAAGSTGLGLAIVDAVTAAHRGSVTVTSEPGRTRFVITLPRLDPPGPSRPPAPRQAAAPAPRPASQPTPT
jgi:two-component system OmpR family sensor kinase